MKTTALVLLFLCQSFIGAAQVIATDFSLTDSQGNSFHLYDELDLGKPVVLDFFGVNCGTCQTNTAVLEDIWQLRGYGGDSLWVWGIEATNVGDSAVNAFQTEFNATYPGFSTWNDDVVLYSYHITYTPQYWVVCPDRTMKQVMITNVSATIDGCFETTASEIHPQIGKTRLTANAQSLILENVPGPAMAQIFSVSGNLLLNAKIPAGPKVEILLSDKMKKGMYFLNLTFGDGTRENFRFLRD
jgi:thiol-disulfide isomerase/thioredoxin